MKFFFHFAITPIVHHQGLAVYRRSLVLGPSSCSSSMLWVLLGKRRRTIAEITYQGLPVSLLRHPKPKD